MGWVFVLHLNPSFPIHSVSSSGMTMLLLLVLGTVAGAPSSTSTDSGSSLGSIAASGAAGVLVGMVLAPSPKCKDVGIDRALCAVLYDEENCDRSNNYLSILPGTQGV